VTTFFVFLRSLEGRGCVCHFPVRGACSSGRDSPDETFRHKLFDGTARANTWEERVPITDGHLKRERVSGDFCRRKEEEVRGGFFFSLCFALVLFF
jgi:hypothetical protein